MHYIEVHHKGSKVTDRIPENLQEVEQRHIPAYIACAYGPEDPVLRKRVWLESIANRKMRAFLDDLNDVQWVVFLECADWIAEQQPAIPALKDFEFQGKTYQGPKENLETSCLIEYVMADAYAQMIQDDQANLDLLMACLYREIPKGEKLKKTRDQRAKFDGDELKERAVIFKKLPISYKLATFYFWYKAKEYIIAKYKDFYGAGEFSFIPKSEAEDREFDWSECMIQVAKSGVFGALEEVKFANLHEVLLYLDSETREAKKRKKPKSKP